MIFWLLVMLDPYPAAISKPYLCRMLEDKNQNHTPLSELGEFGLIHALTRHIKLKNPSTRKGVGDDAAVLHFEGEETLISTDLLVEGIHFNLAYTPLKHLGYKAVVVNLSDIYAMHGQASQILVSLAVSNRFGLEALETLYAGIYAAAERYGVDVVGGDTTASASGLLISITAVGHAKEGDIVYRTGAEPSDLLVVSGDLGSAYMGLQILERENEVFKVNPQTQPDLSPYAYLLERQLKPEARRDIPELLKTLGVRPTAMIDLSDGLASEILHLCARSEVGVRLYEDKIPLDPQLIRTAEELNLNSSTAALNGGEDYELLFTIKAQDYDKIKGNPHLSVIGHLTAAGEGAAMVTRSGVQIPLEAQGFDALKSRKTKEGDKS